MPVPPYKKESLLGIDAYAIVAGQVTPEGLQPVPGRTAQKFQCGGVMQLGQLAFDQHRDGKERATDTLTQEGLLSVQSHHK